MLKCMLPVWLSHQTAHGHFLWCWWRKKMIRGASVLTTGGWMTWPAKTRIRFPAWTMLTARGGSACLTSVMLLAGGASAGGPRHNCAFNRARRLAKLPTGHRAVCALGHLCDTCIAQKGPTQRSHAPLKDFRVEAPMECVWAVVFACFPSWSAGTTMSSWPWIISRNGPRHTQYWTRAPRQPPKCWLMKCSAFSVCPRNYTATRGGTLRLRCSLPSHLRVKKTQTTPLHPQSINKTLAIQFAVLTSWHQRDWDEHLPLVLWIYRTVVQESAQLPAALMFGRELWGIWVYCPALKRGLLPKLMSHWVGLCTVLAQLSDVVCWVQLVGRLQVVVLHATGWHLTNHGHSLRGAHGNWASHLRLPQISNMFSISSTQALPTEALM